MWAALAAAVGAPLIAPKAVWGAVGLARLALAVICAASALLPLVPPNPHTLNPTPPQNPNSKPSPLNRNIHPLGVPRETSLLTTYWSESTTSTRCLG